MTLWDLDALCLRWRAGVAGGAFAGQGGPHRLVLERPGGGGPADVVVRRVPLQDSGTFLTVLARLPHPLALQPKVPPADVPPAYLLCGAGDGKVSVCHCLAQTAHHPSVG